MPNNYWFKTLFFLLATFIVGKVDAQVKFKVALSPDSTFYQVSLLSEIGPFFASSQNFVPTATVTLIAPTGELTPASIANQKGIWSGPDTYINPVGGLDQDYFVFSLNGAVNDIVFTPGLEVDLFTFTNSGNCAGAVELMDNDNDPFREQDPTANVGNHITVFGNGQGNSYGGIHDPRSANCMGFPPCNLTIGSVTKTDILTCGADDGSITINATNGTGTLEYSINNGLNWFTTNTFNNLAIGNYTIIVKDDNCEQTYDTNPVTILEPNIAVTLTDSLPPSCNSSLDGQITVAASGGVAPYEYSINNGANWTTNGAFTSLGNGIFNIKARNVDSTCETSYPNAVVFSTQGINLTLVKTDISCTNGTNGTISITAEGGMGSFQYSIDNGVTWLASANFTDLAAGNYMVLARNSNGTCEVAFEGNPVVISESALNFTVTPTDPDCNGVADGTISIDLTGETSSFEYTIDDGTNWVTNATFSNLDIGAYTIKVRKVGGTCETAFSNNPVVLDRQMINISVSTFAGGCDDGMTNSITVAASGGNASFQYSKDDGATWQNSNIFNSLANGDYTIKVRTTDLSCETAFVNNPVSFASSAINVGVSSSPPACHDLSNGSITVTANGGTGSFIYSIDGGANYSNLTNFTGLANGNYNIFVKNADGTCETEYPNNPIQFNTTAISFSVSENQASCLAATDGSISMLGNGGSGSYEYSIDSGMTWSAVATQQNLAADLYYVFIRSDNQNCELEFANNPIDLRPDALTISIVSNTPPSCETGNDGSLVLAAAGGGSTNYQYSIDDGATYSGMSTFQNLSTGDYNLKAKIAGTDCEVTYVNNPVRVENFSCEPPPPVDSCFLRYVLTENEGVYTISLATDTTWLGFSATTSNAQVSIRVPTGGFSIANFTNKIGGVQFGPAGFSINPSEATGFDFFTFNLQATTISIPYIKGDTVELFSFENSGTCTGGEMYLIGDEGVSDPGVANTNFESQITVAGWGGPDAPICNSSDPVEVCLPPPPCVAEFVLAENNGTFTVGMIPDTTWAAPLNTVNSAQITLRMPAKGYQIENFQNANSQVQFEVTSRLNSPAVDVGYDYLSVTLNSFGTTNIPFSKGVKTDLFSFEINGGCSTDSIALVGDGSLFDFPNDEDDNVTAQMTVAGWGGPDLPVCVQSAPMPICTLGIDGVTVTDVTFCGASDGTITITATCAGDHTRYSVDNGRSYHANRTFTNLSAGNYFIRLYNDSTDCEVIYNANPVVVNDGAAINFTATAIAPTCADSSNGSITIVASNGSGNFQYSIDDGRMWSTTATFTGLINGNYNLKVSNLDTTCITTYDTTFLTISSLPCDFDSDNDGTPDLAEDLNMDGNLDNDNTDGDEFPNYLDDDDDNDGILTALEEAGPNDGDANGDGQPDCLQANVATTQDDGGAFRTLEVSGDGATCDRIMDFIIHSEGDMSENDPNYDFPFQLNAFTIPCGGTVNVQLFYHNVTNLADFTYRKFGPMTPGGATSEWYDFPVTISQVAIGGNTIGSVAFQLTDGQRGDATIVDNMIVDPGGIAMDVNAGADCAIRYNLVKTGEIYEVSLTSDTTISPNNINDLAITLRAPTGILTVGNIVNASANVLFELDTTYTAPTESPNYDYLVFKLSPASANTTNIDIFQDNTESLFSFENVGACSNDSLFLVGMGADFTAPTINGQDISSSININGWNAPTCVSNAGGALCLPAPRDTVLVDLFAGLPTTICLDSEIQLPNGVGNTSVLFQGTAVTAATSNSDSCVLFMPQSTFTGTDFVTVVFCDNVNSSICDTTTFNITVAAQPTCLINYFVEDSLGKYKFKMVSDTTWNMPQNEVISAQFTIRTPTGSFEMTNLQNGIGVVDFDLQTTTSQGGYDYLNIVLQTVNTLDIPFIKGDTICLFSFENGGACTNDSLYLIGQGSPVSAPTVGDEPIFSKMAVQGWGGGTTSVPACVMGTGVPICPITAPETQTINLTLNQDETVAVCIDSVLQLLNNVGTVTICDQGTNISVAVTNNDSCVNITTASDFVGTETLCVVHCDAFETGHCDTTYFMVTVIEPTPEPVTCLYEYIIEESNGVHTVRLAVDSTIAAPFNATSSMLVAIRVPTTGFNVPTDSITSLLPGAIFENTSNGVFMDNEEPDFGYIYFDINGAVSPNYQQGDTLDLFSFRVEGCIGGDIHLVGTGANFANPMVNGEEITSYLAIGAFLADGGAPSCVNPVGTTICTPVVPPTPAPQDTLQFVLDFETAATVCIDSAIQLLTNVGTASICGQGTNITVGVTNGDSCITLTPATNFSGTEMLCVVHCDAGTPDYCDTTILMVTVNPNDGTPPPQPPSEDTTCHITFELELVDGTYTVSFTPDTTIRNVIPVIPNPFTNLMEITLRAPTGKLNIVNQVDFGTGREFVLKRFIINPSESLGYDYFTFGLNENNSTTVDISYVQGIKTELFTFQNFNCALDSIALVGKGSPFTTPLISDENIESVAQVNSANLIVCVSPDAITPPALAFSSTNTAPTAGVCNDGTITITATGGTGIYDYSIDGGSTWQFNGNFSNLENGTYQTLVRSSDSLCIGTAQSVTLNTADCGQVGPVCNVVLTSIDTVNATCSQPDGRITINATGDNLEYSINTGATFQNSNIFENVTGGIYNIVVRDSVETTCEVNQTITLNGTQLPDIQNVIISDSAEFANGAGIITIFATANCEVQYSIDNGQTFFPGNSFTTLGVGTYNIVVTDCSGLCPINYLSNPIIIEEPPVCTVNAGADRTICAGAAIALSATGTGSTFSWAPTDGLSCTDCPNPIANPMTTTTYVVTNNDGNCTATDTIIVNVAPAITADFVFMTSCTDLSVVFTDSSASTANITAWSWDFGDGSALNTEQNPNYTYLASGSYTVSLTTTIEGDCENTIFKTVEVGNGLMGTISDDLSICTGDCTTLMASGGTNYAWAASPDLSALDIPNPIACPTQTTTYYVTISDDNGCSTMDSVTITIDAPTLGVSASGAACDQDNGSITVFASFPNGGPLEFQIVDNDEWFTENSFTGLASGTYNVRIRTADGGCITSFDGNPVIINQVQGPTIDDVSAKNPTECNTATGEILLTASGSNALIYSIDDGTTWSPSPSFTDLNEGVYDIRIAYADTSCLTPIRMVELVAPTAPNILGATKEDPSTCESTDGRIFVSVENGASQPFEYSIDGTNWQTDSVINNLAAGTYAVFVRYSDESCVTEFNTPVTLQPGAGPNILFAFGEDPTTCESMDGQITVSVEEVTGRAFEYSLDGIDWQAEHVFDSLAAGQYDIFVRYDDGTCVTQWDIPVEIQPAAAPFINDVASINPTGFDLADGEIFINAFGSSDIEYSIDNGDNWQTNPDFVGLDTGSYTILVRYTDGSCETPYLGNGGGPVILRVGDCLRFIEVIGNNPQGCGSNDGSIFTIVEPFGNVEYSINNGADWQDFEVFENLGAGTYNILARRTDIACQIDTTITLGEGEDLEIFSVDAIDKDLCNNFGGEIFINTNIFNNIEFSIDNGANWQANNLFSNVDTGTYTILARSLDLICQATWDQPVVVRPVPTADITNVLVGNPTSCGNLDGSIIIETNFGFNTEYSIDNGATWRFDNQFLNLPSGNYTVKIRTGSCEVDYVNNPVNLGAANGFTVVDPIPNAATCTGTLMSLSVTLSDNISSWLVNNGSITNPNINGATLTFDAVVEGLFNEYELTFTNSIGCEVTESFVIFQADDTEADFVVIEPYCKEMEVSLLFTGTATPMANLIWEVDGGVLVSSSPATDTEPAGNEIVVRWDNEGSRLIKLTVDDGGCIDDEYESIFVRKLPLANAGEDVSICMSNCTQLEGTGTGVWYSWSPATGLSSPDVQNPIACPTETTTYTLTVMSADGCVSTDEVTVNVETNFITTGPDVTICEGESANLSVTGANNYTWTSAMTLDNPTSPNPVATPVETTTYSVFSMNENGCMDTATVTVFVNPLPEAVACEDKTICRGDSIQLIVTTFAQYSWSPTNTLINPTSGTPIAFPTETTTYTVTVTDEFGCTDTDEVVVFVNTPPTVTASADVDICAGASTRLNASGANAYVWSPIVGLSNPNLSNPIATPLVTTTYTVTGTDANGCTHTDQVTVNVVENAGISAGLPTTICEGETTQLVATGGTNYQWSPATGLNSTNIANPIANPTVTTTYTLTGVSANGCPSISTLTVTVLPKPEPVACEDKMICLGDSIQLIVTTFAQYSWSPTNSLINPTSGTPTAFPTETTTYTVTVTDENGCTNTDEVTVFVNNQSAIALGPDITLCEGGPVPLDAGTGIAYEWIPSTGLSDPTIRNPIATVNSTITYTVLVTNQSGCIGRDEITITVNGAPNADAGPPVVICPGETGQLQASGGVSYQWSPTDGLSNPNIANPFVTTDRVTTYQVTVTDEFGCTSTDETLVAVSLPLMIDPVITDATCCGTGGMAALNVSGGFGNATFEWSPNVSTTNSATNLTPGFYKVVIEDAERCGLVFTFEIKEDCNGCPDMFAENERCINDTSNTERICLPIALEDIGNYEILVDGNDYNPDHGCDFENLTAYSYALVEGQGTTGMYRVENWEVNGQMYATEVETMQELTNWMNTVDPTGNWINNSSIVTIIGGNPNNAYGTMKVIQLTKWVETMLQPDVTGVATSTVLEIDVTGLTDPRTIIITNELTCCSDTIILRRCGQAQPCVEEVIAQNQFNESITCGETASICLDIPFSNINNFEVVANDNLYAGEIKACNFDSMFAYTYFTLPGRGAAGPYRINSWLIDGQMNSGMFNDLGDFVALMNQIDPSGNWILDESTLTLQGGKSTTDYGEIKIEQIATGSIATLEINSNLIPMGTELTFTNGNYEVLFINKNTGCQDRILVNVSCDDTQTPIDTTMNPVDTMITPIDTTTNPVDTMVTPIDTTMNPVDTMVTPVDTMTNPVDTMVTPVDTTTNPVDTMVTPVDTTMNPVDTMTEISCDFLTDDVLFATVNRCDSMVQFCLDIPYATINDYRIYIDGQVYGGALSSCGTNTYVEVGVGGYNFKFENLVTNCQDSIILAVTCATNAREEIIELVEGDTMIYCPQSENLVGDIISIENTCPAESGTIATVELDTEDFCVNVVGLVEGEESACFVVCDANGVCDTTNVTILVTPKSVETPIANLDIDTTEQFSPITIDVLANDSIFGTLENMEILEKPQNGTAVFNADNTITYTPDETFCNSVAPDFIMYGICNENGCDTAMVEILVPCTTLEIMNGFSPNNDGINDFFTVKGIEAFPENEVQIFNRWGTLVFKQQGYKNRWDGTFDNQLLPDGTYFYLITVGEGEKYSGFVQINR